MKTKDLRRKIRIYTYVTALVLCLGISTIKYYSMANKYEYELRAKQQSAVIELAECVDSINVELNKGLYANTSPMVSELSTSLARDCAGAKNALSQISVSGNFLEFTYKYLSQVSDFIASLNQKMHNGTPLSNEDRDTIADLLNYSQVLLDNVNTLIAEYETGSDFKIQTQGLSTALSDIEQSFEDYPTLIYDGPFSDHVNQEDAAMLESLTEISEEEALKLAAKYSGLEADSLIPGEPENGVFSCYTFSTESTSVSITKKGGLLCSLLSTNRVGEESISEEEAIQIGLDYLNSIGYAGMTETYFFTDDGICTINYALEINGVICYTDLIKVSVALDNGRVLSVDARGYILNHEPRTIASPLISSAEAQKSISPNLTVTSVRQALIPSGADSEYHCYEFLCSGKDDDHVLVYVDVGTGVERDILLLLYSDGGTLTK